MQLQLHTPGAPLGQYIQNYIYHSGFVFPYEVERLVPDGTVNLIFDLKEQPKFIYDHESLEPIQKCRKVWLSGMHTAFLAITASQHAEMLVVSFRPGGAHPFVHLPLAELRNKVVDADTVFGDEVYGVRERLLDHPAIEDKFGVVGAWLLQRLRADKVHEAVVRYAIRAIHSGSDLQNLATLSDKTGYSQKQFIHLFKRHVGLTPKVYQRVWRFNQVLQLMHQKSHVDWTSLTHACGYYDQAHFIKEFKRFSGLNPEHYLRTQSEYVNYSPIA